ncbi:MAG: type III-B CRISPR module RAMP protein Cmr1 [Thermodesulfobacteriota bacterium]|nr:type III-B CRISPR module RAMP protein Cmr1 [Thermodesulfobacteriota bacterium]
MASPTIFTIPVKAITPIWTGDAERKTSYIKGSSLIGGLRFWTEALLRAQGEHVCDITNKSQDKRDTYDSEEPSKKICRVCETFGCTGLGRSFSLMIHEGRDMHDHAIGNIKLPRYTYTATYPKTNKEYKKTPAWFLRDSGLIGNLNLELVPLRPQGITAELALALTTMLKWGTLGAKDQFGFGIVKVENFPEGFLDIARKAIPAHEKEAESGLSLRDFFFFKAKCEKPYNELPFEIRYLVRQSLRENGDRALRHYFCGSTQEKDKAATKYNIGLIPNGTLIGWGYYQKDGNFGDYRERCLDSLKKNLNEHNALKELQWVEYNSERDTEKRITNWIEFLTKIFEGEWKNEL